MAVMEVEIFRPGSFRSMEGADVSMPADVLRNIAASYDAGNYDAPAVVGHPEHDSPAYGWVKKLRYDDGQKRLLADIDDLAPAFAQAVKAKAYKKISASFFAPDSAANPKPGQFYLRHVGFLGGAAPGVPGLKTVSLSAGKGKTVTFTFAAEYGATAKKDKSMALFDGFKGVVAKILGQEAADKLFGSDEMKQAEAELEKAKAETALENAAAAEPSAENAPAAAAEDDDEKKKEAASFAALSAREAAVAKREKEFREKTRAVLREQDASFCDEMIRKGKLLPNQKADTLKTLEALSAAGKMSFADGSEGSAREAFKNSIRKAPARVSFAEGLPDEDKDKDKASFEAPDSYIADSEQMDLYAKAKKYQAEHPDVSWADAVKAVS